MKRWIALAAVAALGLGGAPLRAEPPAVPRVLEDLPKIGRPGGSLRMLVTRSKDTRLMYVYGYARLVGYTPDLRLVPDILESFTVEDGRIFTFRLRPGHRWSDGAPFTSEDFRFWWEDWARNQELRPYGLPPTLLVAGEPPEVSFPDARTVRYAWSRPNPLFLPRLAAAAPLIIYAPAHYLRRFHRRYADPDELARLVAEDRARDWVQLFYRRARAYRFTNPDLPTLQPWRLVTRPPAQRFVFERNPYFHRVDARGQQLPYIDRVVLEVVSPRLVPVKTGAGETDLQFRGLSFKDVTFLKQSEGRSGLRTLLWKEGRSAHLALYPNLTAKDPVWRRLFRDRRLRLALSLALDRTAISQFLYFGMATPANNTLLPESPLWEEEIGRACLGHDPARANALLDELGLVRGEDGIRRLPDGRPFELVIETAGEEVEQIDVLELVRDQWARIGLRVHVRPTERELLRNRIFSGEALMVLWWGHDNGVPTADMSPAAFAPTSQADQPQWSRWGQYYETGGRAGEPPDLPAAMKLLELFQAWTRSRTTEERSRIWKAMLRLYASECFTIGLVKDVMQPVMVRRGLENVPETAVYAWDPFAQIGVYRPDTFFWAR